MKKYLPISNELFIHNRKRFTSQMQPNTMAIFFANDEAPRSADGLHPFRQNSDLFYLSGIDQEQTILILFPDCEKEGFEEVLFVRKTNEHIAIWEGHKYTIEEARAASGIKNVRWLDDFDKFLPELMFLADGCYLNLNEHTRYDSDVPYKDLRMAQKLKEMFPLSTFLRAAPILHKIRAVKSDIEISLMQTAIDITAKAFDRVMRFMKNGVTEYEIEAEILHEFIRNRATGVAYGSIIASGANACVLHYVANNQVCRDGDLVLMDFGAEYANYAADLSRTIPVSGKFSPRQKAVYEAVLRVQKAATAMLRPGTLLDEYHKEVGKVMESELLQLGLISQQDIAKQNPEWPAYKKYFMHGTSHFLGLDVHDVGLRNLPMQAGMVFTVEPGIYILEEGIGVRIENDVLVTDSAPVDLMAAIPREVEEIEDIMNA
ncbi:MAG: aminopeptidase P N-terminal domain-containing protein [Chitinophagales bacterium]|nr:aminopeptidase P N-terminal domain-containing protein [Bacteroidota bacterium]MCB9042187.1 aminopeptidase P N-terminal domain-containing protein [Chitinophagales bacterium]